MHGRGEITFPNARKQWGRGQEPIHNAKGNEIRGPKKYDDEADVMRVATHDPKTHHASYHATKMLLERLGIDTRIWKQAGRPLVSFGGMPYGSRGTDLMAFEPDAAGLTFRPWGDRSSPESGEAGGLRASNEIALDRQVATWTKEDRQQVIQHELGHAAAYRPNGAASDAYARYAKVRGMTPWHETGSGEDLRLSEDYAEFYGENANPNDPSRSYVRGDPRQAPYGFNNGAGPPTQQQVARARRLGLLPKIPIREPQTWNDPYYLPRQSLNRP